MHRIVFSTLAALACLFGVQSAAAQAYDARALRMSVNLTDLKVIVGSLPGHKVEKERIWGDGDEVDVSLRAANADGLVYVLVGTACEPSGCSGVMMQVRYECDSIDYARLNNANLNRSSITMWFDEDAKMLGVTRYVILDHGITMQNLRENLAVLLDIAPDAANDAMAAADSKAEDEDEAAGGVTDKT
ncbi:MULTISPECIES: YbjN domain-containing protein [unclassified Novosphingobium]|uniref:YbjN domain-containing protein n=1 Tax=unclassified Novosphingobium TaxID=2644732 RepID=UPI00135B3377|nr:MULTISPECIES: YbjN domain-containing protein [unclassified Novosphingobium]